MQFEWLRQQSANSVIVIFSGWGFSSELFTHLLQVDESKRNTHTNNQGLGQKYDVIFITDYRQLSLVMPDLSSYQKCYVIAWSFGVSAFATWFSELSEDRQLEYQKRFDRCIAVNGSMQPIDRYMGIPKVIVQKTIDKLSVDSFVKFALRCFGGASMLDDVQIDVPARKQELEDILKRNHQIVTLWDLVWISKRDKIFPAKNLNHAWQTYNDSSPKKVKIQYCDAPHAPFHTWSSWDDIIDNDV